MTKYECDELKFGRLIKPTENKLFFIIIHIFCFFCFWILGLIVPHQYSPYFFSLPQPPTIPHHFFVILSPPIAYHARLSCIDLYIGMCASLSIQKNFFSKNTHQHIISYWINFYFGFGKNSRLTRINTHIHSHKHSQTNTQIYTHVYRPEKWAVRTFYMLWIYQLLYVLYVFVCACVFSYR